MSNTQRSDSMKNKVKGTLTILSLGALLFFAFAPNSYAQFKSALTPQSTPTSPAASNGNSSVSDMLERLKATTKNGFSNLLPKPQQSPIPTPAPAQVKPPFLMPPPPVTPSPTPTPKPPFLAAAAPMTKEQCFSKINQKLREITVKDLEQKSADGKYTGTLVELLNNQTERSFIRFSRAFIRAGYYRYTRRDESPELMKQLSDLYQQMRKSNKVSDQDILTIQEFFATVNSDSPKLDEFDKFAHSLVKFSKEDDPSFHIGPEDLLVMKSIITYTRSPNKRKMSLQDRLIEQMRQVFPKRNFETDDLSLMKSYHDRYLAQSGSESFAAAKKAFADNAKQVITAYVHTMDKQCKNFFLASDGSFKVNDIPSSCNGVNYLQSLFSADPLSNVEPLISYLNQEGLGWENDQFIRVAGIKAKPRDCTVKDNKLTLTMDIENLPIKFTKHWYISCEGCDQGNAPLTNPKLNQKIEETRTITFSGNPPKELYITSEEVPNRTKVSLAGCLPEAPIAPEAPGEPTPQVQLPQAVAPVEVPAQPTVEVTPPATQEAPPEETPNVDAPTQEEPLAPPKECDGPNQEMVAGKCQAKCKDTEYRDTDSGKCISNDVDDLLKPEKDDSDRARPNRGGRSSGSGRTSSPLPQPKLISIPQSSFYIKAGFN